MPYGDFSPLKKHIKCQKCNSTLTSPNESPFNFKRHLSSQHNINIGCDELSVSAKAELDATMAKVVLVDKLPLCLWEGKGMVS